MIKLKKDSFKSTEVVLKEFPIHIEKTNNKVASNKFVKINNQSIYNGAINRFTRAVVVNNLHSYVVSCLPDIKILDFPLKVSIKIKTVINHGSISRRSGKTIWKEPKEDYSPNWDIDNLSVIWIKVIKDSLTLKGIIPDDNVKYIRAGGYSVEFVDDIKDREIIIKIERI